MKKKLIIEVWYDTDDNPDEGQVIKEELEWVMDKLSVGSYNGYNEYPNAMTGEPEISTQYKIEEL